MTLTCPFCKSTSVTVYMGFQFGKYLCKSCGYIGSYILDIDEAVKKRKKGTGKSRKTQTKV